MNKLRNYIRLLRPAHCIKNILIWLPLIFNGSLFTTDKCRSVIWGFLSFTLMASAVYIINDMNDAPKDRLHPSRKNRPIASGEVSVQEGIALMTVCLAASLLLNFLAGGRGAAWACLIIYLLANIAYSRGLKNIPILDIAILTSGFVIRLIYGGLLAEIPISGWLYLTVITASFYMGLGKRRNEMQKTGDGSTRKVLRFYNYAFLDKNMYLCLGMAEVFYALWAMSRKSDMTLWTVPVLIIIGMKYSLDIEGESSGDPVEVIRHDKILWVITAVYAVMIFLDIYVK